MTDLLDDENNEKNGWTAIKGDALKMHYRDTKEGKIMIKCEKRIEMDFLDIYCVLYEDDYYIDWVSHPKGFKRTQNIDFEGFFKPEKIKKLIEKYFLTTILLLWLTKTA